MSKKLFILVVLVSLLSLTFLLGFSSGENNVDETEAITEVVNNYTLAYENSDQELLASVIIPEDSIIVSHQFQEQEAAQTEHNSIDDYLSAISSNTSGVLFKEWNINDREITVEGDTAAVNSNFYGYSTIADSGYIEAEGTLILHLSKVNESWYIDALELKGMVEDYSVNIFMLTHTNQTLKYFGME
ncbi:MAG: nuclear transport factor 2 family protein [Halanaerobiales bacterium]